MRSRNRAVWLLLGSILAVSTVACETGLSPFAESDVAYTILGFLDTDADTQFVRIVPLRHVVARGGPEPIEATVTTTDLESGQVTAWRDSAIFFDDGTYGHVFWSEVEILPEHRYRIDVKRSDGALTSAETRVPKRPGDPEMVFGAENESGEFAPLFWPGVTRVIDADVSYWVHRISCIVPGFPPPEEAMLVFVRYEDDDIGARTDNNEWRIELNLRQDRDIVNEVLGLASIDACVALYGLEVRLAAPSEDWEPPGGVWDRDVLIQPGTFSNVTGGLGWFGSVARSTVEWNLSTIALRDLNYEVYFEQ